MSQKNILKKANKQDVKELEKLLEVVVNDLNKKGFHYWDGVYDQEKLYQNIGNIYKIVVDNKIIGAVNLSDTAPLYYIKQYAKNATYLSMLCIHPDYRNRYNSLIIKAISSISTPTIILDCTIVNRKLNNLYIRIGAAKIDNVNIENYNGIVYKILN